MCGICGIVNNRTVSAPDISIVKRMIGRLSHRGPDSSGYYRDNHVALGHSRLAIIDLEGGAQPLSNENGTIWITFNGEIYNYVELSAFLKKRGHVFRTKSDTEVIIHAYEEWGTGCFERFNGQWALALWNSRDRTMAFARDRLGIRPLYYTFCKDRLLFASEIKALFAYKEIKREIDLAGLHEIFTFWCPIAPRTVFKGIQELQPGHYAVLNKGKFIKKPYWTISFPLSGNGSITSSKEDNAHALKNHIIAASQLRFTRSDVPVGAYLSGGIDSSITTAIVSKYTKAPLRTYSLRFSESEFDEGFYQQEIVKRLRTDHRDVRVSLSDIVQNFPSVIWHTEMPILRTAPAPLFILSRLVRESGYKVVVTGEGSDEVLAGYDIFREAKVRYFLARDPSSEKRMKILAQLYPWMERSPGKLYAMSRAFFGKHLDTTDLGFSHRPRWDTTATLKFLLDQNIRREMEKTNVVEELLSRLPVDNIHWDPLSRAQWLEMTTLLPGYILSSQGDKMLMAHSVEGRFPFLDCEVVDFSSHLPPKHKLFGLDEKHILKIACNDLLPDSILQRPKQPYRAPDAASFFSNGLSEWVQELTSEAQLKKAGLFNPKLVSKLVEKCRHTRGMHMSNTDNMRIVAILSTMLVHHHFIESDGQGNSSEIPPLPITEITKE